MLHTKYRPRSLDEVKGNSNTVSSLRSLLKNKKNFPHALLLCGETGCGKTSLARIIAKELNCDKWDLREINAGNNRGIETARSIINMMDMKPMAGDVRVWIIDEVHRTTLDFQSSLLKVLEDTPKHVYFMLCTTEPEKLLLTMRERCTVFDVRKLSDKQMMELLEEVSGKEKLAVPVEVLIKIVQVSDGVPRRALVILNKICGMDEKRMLKTVSSFASEDNTEVIQLCLAMINNNKWEAVADIIKRLKDTDWERTRRAMLGFFCGRLLKFEDPYSFLVLKSFRQTIYDSGKAGFVSLCYEAFNNIQALKEK